MSAPNIKLSEIDTKALEKAFRDALPRQPYIAEQALDLLHYARTGEGFAPREAALRAEVLWLTVFASTLRAINPEVPGPWWENLSELGGHPAVRTILRAVLARAWADSSEGRRTPSIPTRWLALVEGVTPSRLRQQVQAGVLHVERVPRADGGGTVQMVAPKVARAWLARQRVIGFSENPKPLRRAKGPKRGPSFEEVSATIIETERALRAGLGAGANSL